MRALLPFFLALALPGLAQVPTPILVELFTSEGCSSCPPGDALLGRLRARPEPGTQILALGLHVDYWDGLGWRDPFGSRAWSDRQRAYAAGERDRSLYTPQMRVDGGPAFVGSDEVEARAQLRAAARRPHLRLALHREGDHLRLEGEAFTKPLELWAAWTEEDLGSDVLRGENGGRHLHHASVLRSLQRLPAPAPGQTWHQNLGDHPPSGTAGRPRTLVVFLQVPGLGRVAGAAALSL